MIDRSEIDWDVVERGQLNKNGGRRYASHTCPICGRTIREGAWGSTESNFKRHLRAHERRGEV